MNHTLLPCLNGQAIAQTPDIQPYFNAIRKLISAPADIYDALYLTTLYRFNEFCQAMPFFMTGESHTAPYSLLKHQFNLAITVLKLRRGRMLPTNSESETIAAQEALWTYALFTASLFMQIQHIQTDRTVTLYKDAQTRLGLWHPLVGNLSEPNTYYELSDKPHFISINHHLITTLIGKILPDLGLRWLADCKLVFQHWWHAIVDETDTIITPLIMEAAEKIHYPLIQTQQNDMPVAEQTPEKNDLPQQLIAWLEGKLSENQQTQTFRVKEGFFISLEYITAFLNAIGLLEESLETFIESLDTFLFKKADERFHVYRPVQLEDKTRMKGIIIASAHLSPLLQSQPMPSDVMIDNPL